MSKKKILTEEQKQKIIDLYENYNFTIKQIGKELNICRVHISLFLNEKGLVKNFHLTENEKKDIINLILNGEKVNDISSRYNVHFSIIYKILNSNNIKYKHGSRKYKLNENIFSTYNPESCYWAGFIAADGTIYENMVKITLHNIDMDHIQKFINFVEADYNIKVEGNYSTVCIYSKQIVEDLYINFNLFPCKSLTISMPNIPKDMLRHYIRGYFDGDGSLQWRNKNIKINLISGSFNQIDDIKKYVSQEIGIKFCYYVYDKKRKNRIYVIEKTGACADLFLEWMYADCKYFLDRKFNKLIEYRKKREDVLSSRAQKKFERFFCDRNKKIYDLLKSGMSFKEVGEIYNLSVSSCKHIYGRFKQIGL